MLKRVDEDVQPDLPLVDSAGHPMVDQKPERASEAVSLIPTSTGTKSATSPRLPEVVRHG